MISENVRSAVMIWRWEFYDDFADGYGAKLTPREVNDHLIDTACA